MSYYLIPRTNISSFMNIDYIDDMEQPDITISYSHNKYIYELKERISLIEKDWDIYKKYTNPYEYIHTIIPLKNYCIAAYNPLSRSYFKMTEIVNAFRLHDIENNIRSFHLAEGPGGFIEALCNIRKNPQDVYYGMTIASDINDPNVPGWKKTKSFLQHNKNVNLESGSDNSGDILNIDNFVYVCEKYGSSMDIVTGDGGFDFSNDFNKQELSVSKLLFAQVAFALCLQKKGGSFVLKIFDCFMQHTIDILYILSSFYEKVYIMKPHTSRYANSEKYVICKGFYHNSNRRFFGILHRAFEKMLRPVSNSPLYTHRLLSKNIPYYFYSKIEEYNAIFGQQQIENIHYTLLLIDNRHRQEKIEYLVKNNIEKCKKWCTKHGVPVTPTEKKNETKISSKNTVM
mgnify:CR=1 FL=1